MLTAKGHPPIDGKTSNHILIIADGYLLLDKLDMTVSNNCFIDLAALQQHHLCGYLH